MDQKLAAAINAQIAEEFSSAYIYLAMAAWATAEGLKGTAAWMHKQAQEEVEHAEKFMGHLYDRNVPVTLQAIPKPAADYKGLEDIFKASLKHEQYITSRIHKLQAMGEQAKDYAFTTFNQWFIDEQVEEEAQVQDVLDMLRHAGPDKVFLVDRALAERK